MVLPNSHRISRVPWYSGARSREIAALSPTGRSPSMVLRFQKIRLECNFVTLRPHMHWDQIGSHDTGRTTRACLHAARFRLFPVRSPLLRKSRFLSVPGVTEMFQFSPLASRELCIHPRDNAGLPHRVAPFGNLRVKACVQLSGAYRSLPRPSSPIGAKAFTIRP